MEFFQAIANMSGDSLAQHLANGISLGSLYALIAIGYTMVYGILLMINFAHGDIVMMACYFAFFGITVFHIPWYITFVGVIIATAILGVVIERTAYRPLRDAPKNSVLISAIGASFLLENLANYLFSGRPMRFPNIELLSQNISIGGIQIQPSEFVKIGLILILANFLSRNRDKINEPKTLGMTALICVLPVGMVYLQPNLSTTIVICFMILCMVYVAGISYKWIAGAVAVGVPGFAALIYLSLQGFIPFLQKYQAQRIMGKIFHSSSEFTDLNRQQDNSMMAIGSGQLRGKGLFNNTLSSVKNGNFLSEEQTDFIFAVIGEELGFVGGVAVIALYALLVYECLWIAARAKDTAGRLIASGMAALLAFQSFANIAVATGIFPNTGLPLPFISSGLSSLLSMFIGMGVVLNVGLQRNNVTVQ